MSAPEEAKLNEAKNAPTKARGSNGQGSGRIGLKSTSPNSRSLFLDRRVYQRRRLVDAARLLPFAGLLLFVLPALLLGSPVAGNAGGTTALRLVYFFFAWFCLIAVCATISRGLAGATSRESRGRDGRAASAVSRSLREQTPRDQD